MIPDLEAAAGQPADAASLAAAEAVDIGRDRADLRLAEARGPFRHDTERAVMDHLLDRPEIAAIEPDRIGKVRRALGPVCLLYTSDAADE